MNEKKSFRSATLCIFAKCIAIYLFVLLCRKRRNILYICAYRAKRVRDAHLFSIQPEIRIHERLSARLNNVTGHQAE